MKKIFLLIILFLFSYGCSHHIQPVSQETEKINARILVYTPENFTHFQSAYPTVIKTLSFKFNKPVTEYLPAFLNDTFVKTAFTDTKTDLGDAYDFLVIPEFGKVSFDSDRTFGHELRVTVSMSFTAAGTDPIVVSGTGLAQDMYGGKTVYEQELAEKAFEDALKDLKKTIFKQTG
jgi:hypothetical protein